MEEEACNFTRYLPRVEEEEEEEEEEEGKGEVRREPKSCHPSFGVVAAHA